MKRLFALSVALFLFMAVSAKAETMKCTECGMMSDAGSRFTSRIVQGEKMLYFCDIGDLLVYLNKKNGQSLSAQVKDYRTGDWLDAQKAFYARAEKKFDSPMGWGIAAFKDKSAAAENGSPMDFQGAIKAVR